MKPRIGIYIFVKTPGISKVKTRLAKTIGEPFALEFYQRSLDCLSAMIKELSTEHQNVTPFWAIAEETQENHHQWKDFAVVPQENGDLGERLDSIYQHAQKQNQWAIFIGSDSPHMPKRLLSKAINSIHNSQDKNFLLGKTTDGGFYLFASKFPFTRENWKTPTYSISETSKQLIQEFSKLSDHIELDSFFDVDEFEDLIRFSEFNDPELSQKQIELINWTRDLISSGDYQKQGK